MEIAKRILAIIVIIISVVFIIVCVAGIVAGWSINSPLTETTVKIVSGVERVLTVADSGVGRVNASLAEAQIKVDNLEENVESAGETLSENSLAFVVIERTVGDELFPKIEAARDTAAAVGGSLVAFNETLEAVNEIPFVEVPTLTEDLEAASERMTEIRNDVEETRAELREIREEAVSKRVSVITDRTTRISDRLGDAQADLTSTQDNIQDNLAAIAQFKSRVAGFFDLISAIITFVFLWIAFGQVVLIAWAWGIVKGPSADEEDEESAGQEATEGQNVESDQAKIEDEPIDDDIAKQDEANVKETGNDQSGDEEKPDSEAGDDATAEGDAVEQADASDELE